MRPDLMLVVDEEWDEWVGANCETKPQQLRKENEHKYKEAKNQFKRQGEEEQIFIIEVAVPWDSKLQIAVERKKKRYWELTKQLQERGTEVSLVVIVIVIGALGTVGEETMEEYITGDSSKRKMILVDEAQALRRMSSRNLFLQE